MNEFFRSRSFGWLLFCMLAVGIWISGMWRLPFSIEWHLFPAPLFWVELIGAISGTGLLVYIAAHILILIKKADKRSSGSNVTS